MARKILILITAMILTVINSGCSQNSKKQDNKFDYGVTVNIPNDWKTGSYKVTAEEGTDFFNNVMHNPLYRVRYDYVSGNNSYSLFSLYVFNAVDWNDMQLAGSGEYDMNFIATVNVSDGFAYVLGNLPQENPFEQGKDSDAFNAMTEYITNGYTSINDKLLTIEPTDKKPTVVESSYKTVECDYYYFKLNIPTSWNYEDLTIERDEYSKSAEGFEYRLKVKYSLKAEDTVAGLFTAYVYDNDTWDKYEKEFEMSAAVKIASNEEVTLAVELPQENPLDRENGYGKIFDLMQNVICDFETFFTME